MRPKRFAYNAGILWHSQKRANPARAKIATPFGGGIEKLGSLCGALIGAVIAIGLKHGTNTTDLKKKEKSYELAQKLCERFVETYGSPFCRELIGYDLTKPEELETMRKLNVRDKKMLPFRKKSR